MNSCAEASLLEQAVDKTRLRDIEGLIVDLKVIQNPAERYESQQYVLEQLLEAHDDMDDGIEKFYLWMGQDCAYECRESALEFKEKHAEAENVLKSNRLRRDKQSEATAELVKRWGEGIIPALEQALGTTPSSTLLQKARRLAGKVSMSEGIVLVNRAIYNRLATPKRGVRATKTVTPSDFDNASVVCEMLSLTAQEQEYIGMRVGSLGFLTMCLAQDQGSAIVQGLGPSIADGSAFEFGGPGSHNNSVEERSIQSSYITDVGALKPKGPEYDTNSDEEHSSRSSSIADDGALKLKGPDSHTTLDKGDSDEGDSDEGSPHEEESDEQMGSTDSEGEVPAKKRRSCKCSLDGRATWRERVSKRAPVMEMIALQLLDEMMEMEHVCFKHLKAMGGKIGLRVKTLNAAALRGRLQNVFKNRNRIGDLKVANDTVQWFRRLNRPPHPVDGLGTYKYTPLDLGGPFDYDQVALRQRIGGINMEDWNRDGSVNVDLFGWWWETGIIDIVLSEFEMYRHHLREMNGNGNWGWLRNMFHSTGQQLMRQDPLYYALYAALRPDKHWRLASYPYYGKYNQRGDATYFRHIDINVPAALESGKGVNQIQGTLSLDDEDESSATIILAGTHLEQLGMLWKNICSRGQQTNGFVHRFTERMVTDSDQLEIGIAWKAVPCKKGQVRVTKPTLPHGADGPATGTRRTMLPWFVGVLADCQSLEITDGGTWEGLAKGHREMVAGEASPSGLPALFGHIPYRFPAAVEICGLGPLSDALVARIKWDSPLVLLHRDKMLASTEKEMWVYVHAWRKKAAVAARESHQLVRQLEIAAYGEKSYYYNMAKSEAEGLPMPVIPEDFASTLVDHGLSDSEGNESGNENDHLQFRQMES